MNDIDDKQISAIKINATNIDQRKLQNKHNKKKFILLANKMSRSTILVTHWNDPITSAKSGRLNEYNWIADQNGYEQSA